MRASLLRAVLPAAAVVVVVGGLTATARMNAAETTKKPYVATTNYVVTNLVGWTVHVNRELLSATNISGSNALALLVSHLRGITNVVPPGACQKLQRVPLWLGVNDGHAPCAEYHPSKDWLAANGYNPDKAKAVEIGNAQRFVEWAPSQPMMILHELAHAFHDHVLGFDNQLIRAAFERARKAGSYDAVRRNNGRTERAYAMTDDHEYFAEGTEAFFGTNDFFPFTREELRTHDPDLYQLLEQVWNERQ